MKRGDQEPYFCPEGERLKCEQMRNLLFAFSFSFFFLLSFYPLLSVFPAAMETVSLALSFKLPWREMNCTIKKFPNVRVLCVLVMEAF